MRHYLWFEKVFIIYKVNKSYNKTTKYYIRDWACRFRQFCLKHFFISTQLLMPLKKGRKTFVNYINSVIKIQPYNGCK